MKGVGATRLAAGLVVVGAVASAGRGALLSDVADLIGADALYRRGYIGSRATIANVEAGHVWDGHETLNDGRVAQQFRYEPETTFAVRNHATEVGGTMVAEGFVDDGSPTLTGSGIAFGARLWSGQIATVFGSGGSFQISGNSLLVPMMVFGQVGLTPTGQVGGPGAITVDVVNSSWSGEDDTGDTWINILYDYLADERGVTVVAAAGNAGAGEGKVGLPANSWNVIAAGATDGAGDTEAVASFSSGGAIGSFSLPATRIKPDIVAPGVSIVMPTATGPTSFATASGTSFAAPIVAASAALLVDLGKDTARSTDPRLIKAVLLNSARKLDGWSQSAAVDPNTGTRVNFAPLDPRQGAGRVDLAEAYALYTSSTGSGSGDGDVEATGWDLNSVSASTPREYHLDAPDAGPKVLTATLVWFMDRTVSGFDADSPDPFAGTSFFDDSFDDLDLLVFRADADAGTAGEALAASISGWDPDDPLAPAGGLDSVEHLYVLLPEDGQYVLQVRWTKEVFDFVGDADVEDYALAWSLRTLFGDANRDGLVNVQDLSILAVNWGSDSAGWDTADFTGDGRVGVRDLALLATYFQTLPVGAPSVDGATGRAPAGTLPEPSALVVLLVGAMGLVRRGASI